MKTLKKIVLPFVILAISTNQLLSAETTPQDEILLPEVNVVYKTIGMTMGEPNYTINDAYQDLQHGRMTRPIRHDDIVFAPLEDMINKGLSGDYQREGDTITLTIDNQQLLFFIDKNYAQLNGKKIKLDTPAFLEADGTVFLPFNFVIQALGGEIRWETKRPRILGTLTLQKRQETIGFTRGGDITLDTLFEQPQAWYGSADAKIAADHFLNYQNKDGGWPKLENERNVNLLKPIYHKGTSTIDNDATFTQIRFLAMVNRHAPDQRYQDAISQGIHYILSGQYENGGWPQFFPNAEGYLRQIAINDDALANTLALLKQVAAQEDIYHFIDKTLAEQSQQAYEKGIQFILSSQLSYQGQKTAWAAQYDEKTQQPAQARAYELPSIASAESVGIIKTLMQIDNPSPEIVEAIQSAVRWLDNVKIRDYKMMTIQDYSLPAGRDRRLVKQEGNVLWARFYDLNNNQPLFASRDSVPVHSLEEVQWERRANYNWYVETPKTLLLEDYPCWQSRWVTHDNVLSDTKLSQK